MLNSIKAGVRTAQVAHLSCNEPMMIPLQIMSPTGESVTVATASAQPTGKNRKRKHDTCVGGYHACHLFKHEKAGVIPYLKDLLRLDHEMKAAVLASPHYSTSKKGNHITNTSLLAESMADRVWAEMSDEEKQAWKVAAVASNRTLDGVDWPDLAAKARRCRTLVRFVAKLHALVGTRAANGACPDGVPSFVKLFM
jgi:hypothetical protein